MITAAILALAACAGQSWADEKKLSLTQDAWHGYQQYEAWLTSIGRGVFAVSEDGVAWGYWGCPNGSCAVGQSYVTQALDQCEKRSGNAHCLIFARDHEILVPYAIR
jgi:hypothetical protein